MTPAMSWMTAVVMYAMGAFLLVYFNGAWFGAIPGVALVVGACILITVDFWKSCNREEAQ